MHLSTSRYKTFNSFQIGMISKHIICVPNNEASDEAHCIISTFLIYKTQLNPPKTSMPYDMVIENTIVFYHHMWKNPF
jgi:hypothetical protein